MNISKVSIQVQKELCELIPKNEENTKKIEYILSRYKEQTIKNKRITRIVIIVGISLIVLLKVILPIIFILS